MEVSDRERSILARLSTSRFATVQELSALLDVSEVTVRRYLEKLEQDGMLTRTRGGAFLNESMLEESSFGSRRDQYIEEKRRIAVAAAAMIDDGDTIALSAGTTTYEIARCLKERRNLTVVTNSISIASELATCPGIRLLVTGGTCRERSLALVGALAERSLVGLYVNQTFLGTSGFSLEHGLTTPNFEEALVNAAMVRAARRTVVAVDSSKFGQVSLSLIVPVAAVHSVITDTGAPAEVLDALRAMPKEVITV
ncbi:MAG: DeoR/GlpR family DNA-binding transcription regulator [Mycobacterium leprae]